MWDIRIEIKDWESRWGVGKQVRASFRKASGVWWGRMRRSGASPIASPGGSKVDGKRRETMFSYA